MLTINDVESIVVSSSCAESWPCQHSTTLTLKDGRTTHLNSYEVWAVVSKLADERINPGINPEKRWGAESVRLHFRDYSTSLPDMGWHVETAEVVLNRRFGSNGAQ